MIAALANPKVSFMLVLLVAVMALAISAVLGPAMAQVSEQINLSQQAATSAETMALISPSYQPSFTNLYTISAAAAGTETEVLVRTTHSAKHGEEMRRCFEQGGNSLLYFVEVTSGRVHVVCKFSEIDFYDLIVADRRSTTGYIEEVTAFKVNQYPTITDFINYLTTRSSFPCMPYEGDWLGSILRFIFAAEAGG